jgi:hypothetical protein
MIVLGHDLKLALQSIARKPHHHADGAGSSTSSSFRSCSDVNKAKDEQQQQQHEEHIVKTAVTDHEKKEKDNPTTVFERQSFAIPIQRPPIASVLDSTPNKKQLFMVVVCRRDRITVVIPFIYHGRHETDSALARVFLQQFEQAQRKCLNERNGKNVPICEYRRSNDPPREMKIFQEEEEQQERRQGQGDQYDLRELQQEVKGEKNDLHHAGYLSFTFLEHHVDDEDKVHKAVSNILMTYDFLDYHIKCSKSYIRSRMRSKKDVLMKKLFDDD